MKQTIKIYKMPISEHFPKTHSRAGEKTEFVEKIKMALDLSPRWDKSNVRAEYEVPKLHTIRQNLALWQKRINEVIAGDAILILYSWSGKPYRSAQKDNFIFGKETPEIRQLLKERFYPNFMPNLEIILKDEVEIGVQEVTFGETYHKFDKSDLNKAGSFCAGHTYAKSNKLAVNDGLSFEDFCEWFKNADLTKPLAIIHFTKFRY